LQPSEIAGWQSALKAGLTIEDLARAFLSSLEYQRDFITQTNATVLKREAQPLEVDGWLGAMQAGLGEERVDAMFLGWAEYDGEHGGTAESWLTGLYADVFQRTPDAAGLLHWEEDLQNGISRESVGSPAGTPVFLTSTVTSPSAADMAAGFRYGWTVTKD